MAVAGAAGVETPSSGGIGFGSGKQAASARAHKALAASAASAAEADGDSFFVGFIVEEADAEQGGPQDASVIAVEATAAEPRRSRDGVLWLPAGAVRERCDGSGIEGPGCVDPARCEGRPPSAEPPGSPGGETAPADGTAEGATSREILPPLGGRSPGQGHIGGVSRSVGFLSEGTFASVASWSRSLGIVSVGTFAGWTAHAGYYVLAFFAYWFGAARFDVNEDGEFDPTDVQRMINNWSRHMRFSFSRPRPRGRRLRERLRERRRKRWQDAAEARKIELAHQQRMRQIHDAMEQEQGDDPTRRMSVPSVASNLSTHAELAYYGIVWAGGAVQAAIVAPVHAPECVEETVRDNLRQFLPWFSVSQILLCFGLWLGYALQMHAYAGSQHALFDEAAVTETFTATGGHYECQVKCSSRGDACAGVAFREGPNPECRLLSELPLDHHSIERCEVQQSWNWMLFEKQPLSVGSLLATKAGLETAFPGATSLRSASYCEEGFCAGAFWRLLAYQFTHGSLAHVGGNCFLIFFLGVPLEGFHGTGLTALMYTVGVVGGGMAWILLDPYIEVFGASGGACALLGMQVADLVLNWKQKQFRFPMLVSLVALVAIETASSRIQWGANTTAHSVHLGGLVSGFIIGILLTYNIEKTRWERAFQAVALVVGLGLVCLATAHWLSNPFPAIHSLLSTRDPFCWIGQVCVNEDGTGCDHSRGMQCVVCDTRACVENWYKDENVFCVTLANTESCGDTVVDVVHNCLNC